MPTTSTIGDPMPKIDVGTRECPEKTDGIDENDDRVPN